MVLRELFELLEDYGPSWYTEELHNRVTAALLERASYQAAAQVGPPRDPQLRG